MRSSGFTLIEVLITLGLLTMIAGFGLFATMNMYGQSSAEEERTTLVALLERARSHAMNNLYELPHGVCKNDDEYVIFKGDYSESAIEERVGVAPSIEVTGVPDCPDAISFSQLHGTTTPVTITLIGQGIAHTIEVNGEGRVAW